jgi:hypothetical protein
MFAFKINCIILYPKHTRTNMKESTQKYLSSSTGHSSVAHPVCIHIFKSFAGAYTSCGNSILDRYMHVLHAFMRTTFFIFQTVCKAHNISCPICPVCACILSLHANAKYARTCIMKNGRGNSMCTCIHKSRARMIRCARVPGFLTSKS